MANTILGNYNPLLSLFGNNSQSLSGLLGASSPIVPLINGASSTQSASTDPNVVLISGLGQLLSSLNIFQTSLQQIYSPYSISNSISVTSSNPSVASVSAAAGAQNGNYSVSVSQLAQAQSAVTAFSLADTNSTAVGSGTLTIKTGSYAYTSPTSATSFTPSGSATLSISNGTLSSIAGAINGAGIGMVANIVQNASGNYQLQVSSAETGASNNFQILVSDNDGNNTDQTGLSRLAFDQTQAVGSGQNLSQTQAAQNANFLINGASGSSANNSGITLGSSVSMNLLSTGSTNVAVNIDLSGLNDHAQSLADAYNTLQGSLNALLIRGGLLSNDPIAKQVAVSLNQQATASYSNGNSLLSNLNQIGLSFQYPQQFGQMGSLSFNASSLQSAYSGDSQGTANLLYASARALNWLANSYASYGNGTIPQTLTALQKMQISQQLGQSATPASNTIPSNLASLTSNQSGTIQLSAQQITALSLYAMVYSLGAPYALNAQILNNGLGLSGSSSGNGISTYA